jgi:hypothetical protein
VCQLFAGAAPKLQKIYRCLKYGAFFAEKSIIFALILLLKTIFYSVLMSLLLVNSRLLRWFFAVCQLCARCAKRAGGTIWR